jgi:predicted nucleic acid-binding Zn ribbon protein
VSSFRPRIRKPASAADVLERTLKGLHLDKKLEQYEWFSRWSELVGEEVATVSYPEKLQGGKILVVKVLDIAWAQELSLKKQEILNQLYQGDIGVSVQDIRFKAGDPKDFQETIKAKKNV